MTKQWVLIGQKKDSVDTVIGCTKCTTDIVLGYYTDPRALYDDKIEALKEGYHKFITAQVSNPPKLAPVSDKQLEDIMKALP